MIVNDTLPDDIVFFNNNADMKSTISPAYNPNSKVSHLRWRQFGIVRRAIFFQKKDRFFNTTKTPPEHRQNSTETRRKREQDSKHHRTPSRLTATPRKCHQDANDHRNTIERPPRHQQENRHHQPSGLTPSGQTQPIPERAREGFLFSQKSCCQHTLSKYHFPITIITHRQYRHPPSSKKPSSSSSSSSRSSSSSSS